MQEEENIKFTISKIKQIYKEKNLHKYIDKKTLAKIAEFESFINNNIKLGQCKICCALNVSDKKHSFTKDICKTCDSEGKKKPKNYIYKNSQ